MKRHAQRRGSVLMEFIIVFPIYLILFAGTVAVGDMLIHSNRLGSADRVLAFEVDGHAGGTVSRTSAWDKMCASVFHPRLEIADDGVDQDELRKDPMLSCYAESDVTGPWTVCAAVAATDRYRVLAGGTLGQLLTAPLLLGGTAGSPFARYTNGVDMCSTESLLGGSERAVFFTLKRRDLYNQRNNRRFGTNEYIDKDVRNWRDRNRDCIARLLLGGSESEYWRQHVADARQWHSEATIRARNTRCSDSLPDKTVSDYRRYGGFVELSD